MTKGSLYYLSISIKFTPIKIRSLFLEFFFFLKFLKNSQFLGVGNALQDGASPDPEINTRNRGRR